LSPIRNENATIWWRFSYSIETSSYVRYPTRVGKKKDKDKTKDRDRLGRKDLEREVESLRSQIEALRARLDRIAEIAGTRTEDGEAVNFQVDKKTA
jgi:hypothetical protein